MKKIWENASTRAPRPMTRSSKNGRPKRSEPQNGGVGSGLSFDVARAVTTEKGNCDIEFPNLGECIESLIVYLRTILQASNHQPLGRVIVWCQSVFKWGGHLCQFGADAFIFNIVRPIRNTIRPRKCYTNFRERHLQFSIFDSPQSSEQHQKHP